MRNLLVWTTIAAFAIAFVIFSVNGENTQEASRAFVVFVLPFLYHVFSKKEVLLTHRGASAAADGRCRRIRLSLSTLGCTGRVEGTHDDKDPPWKVEVRGLDHTGEFLLRLTDKSGRAHDEDEVSVVFELLERFKNVKEIRTTAMAAIEERDALLAALSRVAPPLQILEQLVANTCSVPAAVTAAQNLFGEISTALSRWMAQEKKAIEGEQSKARVSGASHAVAHLKSPPLTQEDSQSWGLPPAKPSKGGDRS